MALKTRGFLFVARHIVTIFDATVGLFSELSKLDELDRAFMSCDQSKFDAAIKQYAEDCKLHATKVEAIFTELRKLLR